VQTTLLRIRRQDAGRIGPGLACLAASAILLLAVSPAHLLAHASLLHTEPVANQRLDQAPTQVTLIFSERVETVFNSLRVLDREGNRLDQGEVRVEDGGDTVVVSLKQPEPGPYGVFWRITSLDGHQVQGQFGFGFAADPPTKQQLAEQLPKGDGAVPVWFFPVFRGIGLGALALWLGGVGFLAMVFLPALPQFPQMDEPSPLPQIFRRSVILIHAGGVTFLAEEIVWLVGKTASVTGMPLLEALSLPSLKAVITTTSLGEWWALRWVSAIVLLIITARLFRTDNPKCASAMGGLPATGGLACFAAVASLLLATIAVTGHARAIASGTLPAQIADWVHLTATAVWIGGLAHLLLLMNLARKSGEPGENAPAFLNQVTPRFSRLAQYCVLALLPTGIYSSWLHLPSWSSFLTTDYGRVLTAKVCLVLVILFLALINWKRALPALASSARAPENALRWSARLRRLVGAEALLGSLILVLVAVLTNLPPAAAVAGGGTTDLRRRAGDYFVSLHLDPNKVGRNQAAVSLQDSGGSNLADARRVTFYLRSLDMDMGLSTVEAQPSPDGKYRAELFLSMAGRWAISVEISPTRGDAFVAEFQITSAQ